MRRRPRRARGRRLAADGTMAAVVVLMATGRRRPLAASDAFSGQVGGGHLKGLPAPPGSVLWLLSCRRRCLPGAIVRGGGGVHARLAALFPSPLFYSACFFLSPINARTSCRASESGHGHLKLRDGTAATRRLVSCTRYHVMNSVKVTMSGATNDTTSNLPGTNLCMLHHEVMTCLAEHTALNQPPLTRYSRM